MDGLREFVAKFAAAVEAKDAQFFIDNAYFQTPDCPAFGQPPGTPHFCFGIGAPPTGPAIFLGVWNSEGAIVSQDYYETRVRENLDLERASLYALGQQKNGLEIGSSEVGIVVSFAPKEQSTTPASPPPATSSPTPTTPNSPLPTTETSPSPTIPTPRSPSISAFRLDRTNGEWRIVGIDAGSVNLVPDFFDWYTLWDDAFVTP